MVIMLSVCEGASAQESVSSALTHRGEIQKKSLEVHIRELTGDDVNTVAYCGDYAVASPALSIINLQKSLLCAQDAQKQHKTFRIVVHRFSEDSTAAEGALSTPRGIVLWFSYDSGVGCGPMCERFETKACQLSDVVILVHADGQFELGLKR
jgi:hypothetical protein